MKKNNLVDKKIQMENEFIFCNSTKQTSSISKEFIKNKLIEFLKDENLAIKATNYIYNSREIHEKMNLKKKEIKNRKI